MRTNLLKYPVAAILTFISYCTVLNAQTVLDDRIDSLQRLIDKTLPDTSRIRLQISLTNELQRRYIMQGSMKSDSIYLFRNISTCRDLSTKLNNSKGWGTSFLQEAYFYFYMGDKIRKEELLRQAFTIFKNANDKAGLATAYNFRGDMDIVPDHSDARIRSYDTALLFAREAKDLQREGFVLRSMGNANLARRDYRAATDALLRSFDILKKLGDDKLYLTADLLAATYLESGELKQALQYAIATLNLSRQSNDTSRIVTTYQRLAGVYYNLYNFDKSYYYQAKALASFTPGNSVFSKRVEMYIICQMARCLMMQNKLNEALQLLADRLKKFTAEDLLIIADVNQIYLDLYYLTGQYEKANHSLQQVFAYWANWGLGSQAQVYTVSRAGELYYALKEFQKAKTFSDSAYRLAVAFKSWTHAMESSMVLFRLSSEAKDERAAVRHYRNFLSALDSSRGDMINKQMIELTVQYETDQKNAELSAFAAQTKLQQESIQKGRSLRNVMIVASGLLVLLLLVTFNRYRVKRKSNELLQQKQAEINQQNQLLAELIEDEKQITAEKDKLLLEKEWLMKEVNHRVKNNLQIVMSLLDTQRRYLKDEGALNAINESQHRVHAISLIHKKLYQSEHGGTSIAMHTYVREITEYLSDSLDMHHRIRVELLVEPVTLDVTQAVPVGLVINEAFTNAVKYAFPGDQAGNITIELNKTPPDMIRLIIRDNGQGLPAGLDWQQTNSLGLSLMQGLCRQIDGTFEIINQNGVTIIINFKSIKPLPQ